MKKNNKMVITRKKRFELLLDFETFMAEAFHYIFMVWIFTVGCNVYHN